MLDHVDWHFLLWHSYLPGTCLRFWIVMFFDCDSEIKSSCTVESWFSSMWRTSQYYFLQLCFWGRGGVCVFLPQTTDSISMFCYCPKRQLIIEILKNGWGIFLGVWAVYRFVWKMNLAEVFNKQKLDYYCVFDLCAQCVCCVEHFLMPSYTQAITFSLF